MNINSGEFLLMTCMDALMSRAHGNAEATLDELEGIL